MSGLWIQLEPLLSQVGVFAILAMSLNMVCGMTGMLNIGHAGFYALGAYGAGLLAVYATVPALGWFNFPLAILIAATVAVAAAVVVGTPCLRLRGDYLAIATLAFGEIVRMGLNAIQFPGGSMFPDEKIGGPLGIQFTEFPEDVWGEAYAGYSVGYASLPVIWVFVLLTYLLLRNIKYSRTGRAFLCIREDEIAARAMGINVPWYKLLAFLLGTGLAGLAGALYFHHETFVSPGDFSLMTSIKILLMVVLGGMGSLSGSVLAATILVLLPELLRYANLSDYNQLIYAVLLIALIRLAPNGLLGLHEAPPVVLRLFQRRKSHG